MSNESSFERKEKGNSLKNWILSLGVALAVWLGGRVNAHAQGLNNPAGKPDKSPQPTLVINPTDAVPSPTKDKGKPTKPPTDTAIPPTITPTDTAIPPTSTVDTKATQQADRDATATARDAQKTAEAGTRVAERTSIAATEEADRTATNTATRTATISMTRTATRQNPSIFNPTATMTSTLTRTPSVTSIADFISPSPTTEPQPIVAGPSSYEQIYGQAKTPKPEQASSISRPNFTKDWSELSTEEQEFLINTNLYREYILKVRKEREERAGAKQNNFIKVNPVDLAKRRAETQIESQILNSSEWKELISNTDVEARRRFNIWLDSYLDEVLKNKPNKPLVTPESN